MLRVKVNGPQPFGLPVRAQSADVDREVVEAVAARGGSGLVDQRDSHAVIGIDAPAVLVDGLAQRGRKLQQQQQRQVVLPAGAVPGPGPGAVSIRTSSVKASKRVHSHLAGPH